MITLEKGKRTIIELLENASVEFKNERYVSRKTDNGWDSYTFSEVKKNSEYLAASFT